MSRIKKWFSKYQISKIDDTIKQKIIQEYKNSDQYLIDLQNELEIDFAGEEVKQDPKTQQIKELKENIENENQQQDLKTIIQKGVKNNE
ncbi:MAG: hypothetical protein E7Y34_00995 [Mycoplasma sp.]|nr:hypothetical protein [Mycoplasma sp.]